MTVTFDFHDKTVLVTGASKGIGKAISKAFLHAGANVVACARGENDLEALSAEHPFANLLTISVDATKEKAVQCAIQTVIDLRGKIDILVNNVGGAIRFGNFWDLSNDAWQEAFELNVLSMVNFARHTIPWLKKSSSGRIVNISSISGVEPGQYNPHYTTTKASTINFSKYLANFLAADGVLVNCVCPGSVESDSWMKSIAQIASERSSTLEDVQKELTAQEMMKIPLGMMGNGDDVSQLVLFLASKQAKWITGSCFHVNGGKLRSMC